MFILNKYTKWYYDIIENARNRTNESYTEKHHILPKSMGGNNTKENIVKLTGREHFVCHLLLPKMCSSIKDYHRMICALNFMMKKNKNSYFYEDFRIKHSASVSYFMSLHNPQQGKIPWNKGLTKETDDRIKLSSKKTSEARKGIKITTPRSQEYCEKIRQNNIGLKIYNNGIVEIRRKKSPNKEWKRGRLPSSSWNRGLTKKDHPSIQKISNIAHERMQGNQFWKKRKYRNPTLIKNAGYDCSS